jgi:uncharacterized RDD family membrane protein YckC
MNGFDQRFNRAREGVMGSEPVELRDQLSIDTPELVSIDLLLAGIGSRCLAVLIDYLIQGVTVWIGILLFAALGSGNAGSAPATHMSASSAYKWALAIVIAIPFLLHWGYFTLFEAFWHGQTPGKRLMKLRVIQQSGRALGLFESMGRNLIRFIDMLPGFYFVGALCVFVSRRQQRLGDMVAGTLVVHSTPVDTPFVPAGGRTFTAASFERPVEEEPSPRSSGLQADAVGRLNHEDLQMIDNFLGRRLDLPLDVRAKLAEKLARHMASKMLQERPGTSDETFLESLAVALRQGGLR